MQCPDLPRNKADDQPGITHLNQYQALAWAEGDTTDDLHATLAKHFAARNFTRQPGGTHQEAND